MNLRKTIRLEKNAGQRALLIGCRIKIGTIVRSAKRYESPMDTKVDNSTSSTMKGNVSSMPEVCVNFARTTTSKGGNSGLAKVKAKLFWRGVSRWFKITFSAPCRH